MASLEALMTWTFTAETAPTPEIMAIMLEGEQIYAAYKTIRDVAVVTNKRIVIADKQGITGKKVEIYTIPFKSVVMYSSENAGGLLDFSAELQLWTRAGMFKLSLNKGIDVRKLDRLIAHCIL
jgi:hypothetical protein